MQRLWIRFADVQAVIGGMHRAFDYRLLPPFRVSRTGEVDTVNTLPMRSEGQDDLERGDKDASGPVELTTPASASFATSSGHDDDNVDEAITIHDNNHLDDNSISSPRST